MYELVTGRALLKFLQYVDGVSSTTSSRCRGRFSAAAMSCSGLIGTGRPIHSSTAP